MKPRPINKPINKAKIISCCFVAFCLLCLFGTVIYTKAADVIRDGKKIGEIEISNVEKIEIKSKSEVRQIHVYKPEDLIPTLNKLQKDGGGAEVILHAGHYPGIGHNGISGEWYELPRTPQQAKTGVDTP